MGSEFWFGFVAGTAVWMTAFAVGIVVLGVQQTKKNQVMAEAMARGTSLATGLLRRDQGMRDKSDDPVRH
jgi:hypothetical protein